MIEAVLTPAMFRNRAYDCQWLAERAPNQRVRDILLDMSRTWTRLALEAEEWRRDNSPRSRLARKGATKDRPRIIAPNDARPRKQKRPDPQRQYQLQTQTLSLDGRITGRTRTCWFETLQYDGLGVPYGPYC